MKVSELIERLENVDPEFEVVVAMPDRNNDYCGAEGISVAPYVGEVGYETEVLHPSDVESHKEDGEEVNYCVVIS